MALADPARLPPPPVRIQDPRGADVEIAGILLPPVLTQCHLACCAGDALTRTFAETAASGIVSGRPSLEPFA